MFSCFYRYGFGSEGKSEYKIGPDKDLVYEVSLKEFQSVSSLSTFHGLINILYIIYFIQQVCYFLLNLSETNNCVYSLCVILTFFPKG